MCACFTAPAWGADPALTIYNQNFAVIRETLPLDLKAGSNTMRFSGATAHVEPCEDADCERCAVERVSGEAKS